MKRKAQRKTIIIISMGGSISFTARHRLDLIEYGDFGYMLEIEDLLDWIPEVQELAKIVPVSCKNIPSEAITPTDWLELCRVIHDAVVRYKPDGVVVLHGTSTLEETAFFLNLTLHVELPVVIVGAQGPINALGSDGGRNILNAVQVAKDEEAMGLGVLAVHGNEIHSARDVTKISTHSASPFHSPDFGILGYTDADGSVAIYRKPTRICAPRTKFDVSQINELPKVDIVYVYAGANGLCINTLVAGGTECIVVAGYSPGSAAGGQEVALDRARQKGVFVVLSPHCGRGRVLRRKALDNRGIIVADTLSPKKSRILSMLALTETRNMHDIQTYFNTC